MKIILPWPDKRVFPNFKRGTHWRAYRDAEKAGRELGHALACEALTWPQRQEIGDRSHMIPLKVTFYPPDRRNRDDDGMVGAFKHYRDGIADALKVDDRRFRAHYFFEEPAKPGRVEVEFTA